MSVSIKISEATLRTLERVRRRYGLATISGAIEYVIASEAELQRRQRRRPWPAVPVPPPRPPRDG